MKNNNINTLITKFDNIKNKGWVEGKKECFGSVGITFEKLIGKEPDYNATPDFENIEIKTKSQTKAEYISLFTAAPDNDINQTRRLSSLYGYPDKDYQEYKILNVNVYRNFKIATLGDYKFKLYVNRKDKRIELFVYDLNNKMIDNMTSWSFQLLEEKLNSKLKYLAFINAYSKIINGKLFHKYTDINFYKVKSLEHFLGLIKKDKIRVSIRVGIYKKAGRIGEFSDHGVAFAIKKNSLEELFTKIY